MLKLNNLACLTLWAVTVQAFYPWFPNYICNEDNICTGQGKRTLPTTKLSDPAKKNAETIDHPVTFRLSQRVPAGDAASPVRAAREVDRLRRKYATSKFSSDPVRRDNAFSVVTAATPTQSNSVGIDQDGTDFSYFVEAHVGSSGKMLYLLIDTGAGATWVMGSDCQSTACGMHTTWGPSDSQTYKATGDGLNIAYGSGAVQGALAQDSISIGNLKVNMVFGVANTTSDDFTHFPFDGILGLSMNKGATASFMGTVKDDKLLTSNIFGVALSRNSDGPNTGEISFGGINSDKFTGDITYTIVSDQSAGDWAIAMDNLAYNGKKAGISGRNAYIDTGTSYVFGPADDVAALHKLIPGASSNDGTTFTAPCDTKLPITVSFSGVSHEISVKDWLSAPSSDHVCTSNIYGHEVVSGAWLLGDLFLKNVYAVFDADQSRIGFASRKATAITPSSTRASAATTTLTSTGANTSTLATLITPSPSASTGGASSLPGLSGHETSATAGTAAAETTSPSATSTSIVQSLGERIKSSTYTLIVCIAAAIAFVA